MVGRKNNPKKELTKVCSFTLDIETINILEKMAIDTSTSKSKIICDLIKKEGKMTENELKRLAMVQDGYAYEKNMADLYAKKLKEVWSFLDNMIDDIETGNFDGGDIFVMQEDLKELKNNIPESALMRAK